MSKSNILSKFFDENYQDYMTPTQIIEHLNKYISENAVKGDKGDAGSGFFNTGIIINFKEIPEYVIGREFKFSPNADVIIAIVPFGYKDNGDIESSGFATLFARQNFIFTSEIWDSCFESQNGDESKIVFNPYNPYFGVLCIGMTGENGQKGDTGYNGTTYRYIMSDIINSEDKLPQINDVFYPDKLNEDYPVATATFYPNTDQIKEIQYGLFHVRCKRVLDYTVRDRIMFCRINDYAFRYFRNGDLSVITLGDSPYEPNNQYANKVRPQLVDGVLSGQYQWEELISVETIKGEDGQDGTNGQDGTRGNQIFYGEGDPNIVNFDGKSTQIYGDLYVDKTNFDTYKWTFYTDGTNDLSTWVEFGSMRGNKIQFLSVLPSATNYIDGDIVIISDARKSVYICDTNFVKIGELSPEFPVRRYVLKAYELAITTNNDNNTYSFSIPEGQLKEWLKGNTPYVNQSKLYAIKVISSSSPYIPYIAYFSSDIIGGAMFKGGGFLINQSGATSYGITFSNTANVGILSVQTSISNGASLTCDIEFYSYE